MKSISDAIARWRHNRADDAVDEIQADESPDDNTSVRGRGRFKDSSVKSKTEWQGD